MKEIKTTKPSQYTPLENQQPLPFYEDSDDLITDLAHGIEQAWRDLIRLEGEQSDRQGEMKAHTASVVHDDKGVARWSHTKKRLEHSEILERGRKESQLKGAVSTTTRKVNKQKERVIKLVGEIIDAKCGTQRLEPMQH
ncbi:hypothetical protein Pan241w_11030 [Gimesia alba]|uniref:Uncharacterized protein n=1 Tax=Gimesia alba TaxID=2527973 RepID=A0A517RB27_9PLAN|nr:hypothetical protein [Gimesia alba]QDT41044.1 hypothetical protein Pan241w_11030 [Gimesia alba]